MWVRLLAFLLNCLGIFVGLTMILATLVESRWRCFWVPLSSLAVYACGW
jgi:hypothetical protein